MMVLLTLGLGPAGSPLGRTSVAAQGSALACAPPAAPGTPAAAASPTGGTVAASPVAFPADAGELTVFAAASLTDAFEQIATDLQAANAGLTITYNFAGSQALATQLQEGAEADVFASANAVQMAAAVANGSIAGAPAPFVRNRLAIVVPTDNPAGIAAPEDLAQEGLRLVLAQAEVPVGRYARESLCAMGADPATYGEGFVAGVGANIVSAEEDVRDVLAKVELGEADAGIVYVSDAASAQDRVGLVEIPAAVNAVATYPIAAVADGDAALAAAYIAYLLGPDGQATLRDFGFEPIS